MKQEIELSTYNNQLHRCSTQSMEKYLQGILAIETTAKTIFLYIE